jgi:hypothetical protein
MKKKLILILILAATTTVTMAQKGSWYIGGVAGFGSHTETDVNDDEWTHSMWSFGPEVGTFLTDDIQLGIALGLGGTTEGNDSIDLTETSSFNPTLYGRKFFKITENFSTFGGLYLNFISESMTDRSSGSDIESEGSGFGARLGIGVAYALSPRFTAVGQYGLLGFQSVSFESGGTDAGDESSFDFGVNTVGSSSFSQGNGSGSVFNIGIYYTFLAK